MFFVDVCLKVAYSACVCAGRDSIEPVWLGVSCMYRSWVCCWVCLGGSYHFASWSVISLPIMPMCALTFCIVILCVDHVIWLTMAAMSSLSG